MRRRIIIIIISFLVIGMYSFRNIILNVHDNAPVDFDLNSYNDDFYNLTGVPVLLNTSFNLNGEPIVMSPTDAIRTFYTCGLDTLVIGDYVLQK